MFSEEFLNKIKDELLDQRKHIITLSSNKEVIDTDGDECDIIQGNVLIEMQNQLNTRNYYKLLQIEEALRKIKDSTYGLCEDCEEYIPERRLLFNPYITTCVGCAEARESEQRLQRECK